MTIVIDKLVRYVDWGDSVLKEEYPIVKFTPQGAWIDVWGKQKFVLAGTFKKFACKTEEEAKESFFRRKAKQLKILKERIRGIEHAVRELKEGAVTPGWLHFE